ncbi:hypothetical protein E2C01_063336 [Portunus trituberculatus]|uniref:Uncharacterized protein n=1 Tax=Portunus trituberculatus TaxID=210409 RepID=A0A5B7H8W7_PORTR|nr:hypothetical protein [Portunus trituberculatus]
MHCYIIKEIWRKSYRKYTYVLLSVIPPAGYLTQPLVKNKFDVVLLALIRTTQITPETSTWAQARQQAITSIIRLVETVGIQKDGKGLDVGSCAVRCLLV